VIGSAAVLPVITMACWSLPRMPAPMEPCWLTCSKRPATGSSRHPRHDVSATAVRPDDLDAVLAARSTLVVPVTMLRNRRAGEVQTALQVLSVARDQLNADRLRCLNALTALLRSHNLGIDARRALTAAQIRAIAIWRRREEPVGVATARAETVRLAKRILALDVELTDNRTEVTKLVSVQAPELLALSGVGAITAAVILTAWSHPGRIRSEAAFAQIAGTCPIPASSGNVVRHRLNRGGDRRLNRALNTIVLTRMRTDLATRAYVQRRLAEGKTTKEIRRCLKRYISRQVFRTLSAAHHLDEPIMPAA
jgi:transposase